MSQIPNSVVWDVTFLSFLVIFKKPLKLTNVRVIILVKTSRLVA